MSLSCIVQTLWDLCYCQVIFEATVPLFVILIIMDANWSKNVNEKDVGLLIA